MKKLLLLKSIIDLFWFFLSIAIICCTLFTPYVLFSGEHFDLHMKINGENLKIIDIPSKIMVVVLLTSTYTFAYGIFLMRKLLNAFSNRQIFTEIPIALLNKIGKCFLITSLLTSIPSFIYNATINNNLELDFGGGFESFLFTAGLGLFFMVLSEVFQMGKTIKEENDLTV